MRPSRHSFAVADRDANKVRSVGDSSSPFEVVATVGVPTRNLVAINFPDLLAGSALNAMMNEALGVGEFQRMLQQASRNEAEDTSHAC